MAEVSLLWREPGVDHTPRRPPGKEHRTVARQRLTKVRENVVILSMNADDFRDLALALPEAVEKSHMNHPDFRVRGKIFATLSEDEARGMVKLSPEQQRLFVRTEPDIFKPVNGAWGQRGCTYVSLDAAGEPEVRQALTLAWRNTAPRTLVRRLDEESPS
jgi:hypothetical protein